MNGFLFVTLLKLNCFFKGLFMKVDFIEKSHLSCIRITCSKSHVTGGNLYKIPIKKSIVFTEKSWCKIECRALLPFYKNKQIVL